MTISQALFKANINALVADDKRVLKKKEIGLCDSTDGSCDITILK